MSKIVITSLFIVFLVFSTNADTTPKNADTNGIKSRMLKCLNTAYKVNIPENCEPLFVELKHYKTYHSRSNSCDVLLDNIDWVARRYNFDINNDKGLIMLNQMKILENECP